MRLFGLWRSGGENSAGWCLYHMASIWVSCGHCCEVQYWVWYSRHHWSSANIADSMMILYCCTLQLSDSDKRTKCDKLKGYIQGSLDFTLLRKTTFLLFCLTGLLQKFIVNTYVTHAVNWALAAGVPRNLGVWAVSTLSCSTIVCRIFVIDCRQEVCQSPGYLRLRPRFCIFHVYPTTGVPRHRWNISLGDSVRFICRSATCTLCVGLNI